MERLEQLRQVIDDILRKNPDPEESRCGFVHLYGVSATCTILALKRGLDPELCSAAGMLHDIWNYQFEDCPEHGRLGAVEARKILTGLGTYSQDEIDLICQAIETHSDKYSVHNEMAELLKDADLFQHYLYNPQLLNRKYSQAMLKDKTSKPIRVLRLERVLRDLCIPPADIQVIIHRTDYEAR